MWWCSAAFAWNGSGIDWAWQDAPVEEPFSLHAESFAEVAPPDTIEALFRRSLRIWTVESEADLFLEYGGRTEVTRQGRGDDDVNVTAFGSRDFWAGLAVATTWQDRRDLVDCDIAVHERNGYGRIDWHVGEGPAPRGAFDLSNTLTHELGHCLGLAHSGRASAMMSAYSTPGTGEGARHLTDDDRAGVQALYGRVAPELVLDDGVADPVVDGRTTVVLTVRNAGDGSAFDVRFTADGGGAVDVGDVGAPTPVGERVGPDTVAVAVALDADCAAGVLPVSGVLTDARGRAWDLAAEVALDCARGGAAADGPAGCGCDAAATPGATAFAGLVGLVGAGRSRRRARP